MLTNKLRYPKCLILRKIISIYIFSSLLLTSGVSFALTDIEVEKILEQNIKAYETQKKLSVLSTWIAGSTYIISYIKDGEKFQYQEKEIFCVTKLPVKKSIGMDIHYSTVGKSYKYKQSIQLVTRSNERQWLYPIVTWDSTNEEQLNSEMKDYLTCIDTIIEKNSGFKGFLNRMFFN